MTSPISAIAPLATIGAVSPATAVPTVDGTGAASGASGASFAGVLGKGLDAVSGAQTNADNLAVQAATGQAVDPATYTIAATQASLMTQLAATVQGKAVAAFNQVMGMQA